MDYKGKKEADRAHEEAVIGYVNDNHEKAKGKVKITSVHPKNIGTNNFKVDRKRSETTKGKIARWILTAALVSAFNYATVTGIDKEEESRKQFLEDYAKENYSQEMQDLVTNGGGKQEIETDSENYKTTVYLINEETGERVIMPDTHGSEYKEWKEDNEQGITK